MPQETATKAATIAALIKAEKDGMANDIINDIMSPLTSEESDAIIGALAGRPSGAEELSLEMLVPYGLPYVPDIDEEDYSREGTVELIDRALSHLRLDMADVVMQSEHDSWVAMRPYTDGPYVWYAVSLLLEINSEASFGIIEPEFAIYGVTFSISYECSQDVWETHVYCKLDVAVKQDGRVERLGEVREVTSNWYAD